MWKTIILSNLTLCEIFHCYSWLGNIQTHIHNYNIHPKSSHTIGPKTGLEKTAKQFHCNNSKLKLYLATLSCILSKSMNIKHTALSLNEQFMSQQIFAVHTANCWPGKVTLEILTSTHINTIHPLILVMLNIWKRLPVELNWRIIPIWKQPWYNERLLCHKDFNVLPFHVE